MMEDTFDPDVLSSQQNVALGVLLFLEQGVGGGATAAATFSPNC